MEHCVEVLCDKGCREVWADIRRIEAGDMVPETAELSAEERQAVLEELRDVMAVYGPDGCSVD